MVVNWDSSPLSFSLSAFTAFTYIFTAPTCTTTIISLKPCALNADFQHFILRFNKISLLCGYHSKRGQGGESRERIGGEREGDFTDNFITIVQKPNIEPEKGQLELTIFKARIAISPFCTICACKRDSMRRYEDKWGLLACRTQTWRCFSQYLLLKFLENKENHKGDNIRKRERQNGILIFYYAF